MTRPAIPELRRARSRTGDFDRAHDPAEDVSIAFDDPALAIPWPLPVAAMSRRDRLAQLLAAATRLLA